MSAKLVGHKAQQRRFYQRGQALLIVLASLALVLVIVLPFLLSSRTQMTEAKSSAQEEAAKQLADRCVTTVIAQLSDATTSTSAGGTRQSWASQPGAVRTYDIKGAPVMVYKLFSSPDMRFSETGGAVYNPAIDLPPAAWSTEQGIYTDLNQPVTVSGSNPYTAYPIVDPTGTSTPIEGFSFSTPPGTSSNPLPMPATWLYVLQDGTLVAPSLPSGFSSGDAATVAAATPTNPIVGRIAFWTDDETSKVNINTSSEGTFWDTPRSEGATERNYANYQPAANEFQRYPGHPAMTCLSGIFPGLAGSGSYPEILYPLIPRLSAGGSKEGTATASGALTSNSNRLYASTDEFMFNPSSASRTPNNAAITDAALRQAKFFITANSRAPEVNLFGKPRVTIWPISSDLASNPTSSFTTVTDRLIAFCSTMRNDLAVPYRFYFQRGTTGFPAGSCVGADSQTADISIPRNQQLYAYLHNLTAQPVPGFGGSVTTGILSKYGNDQDQILTEIFDYIRSANLQDGNLATTSDQYSPDRSVNGFNESEWTGVGFTQPTYSLGRGLVCPTHFVSNLSGSSVDTRGFGRFPTVSKVGIWFIEGKLNAFDNNPQLQAALVFDMFDPSLGYSLSYAGYSLQVSVTSGTLAPTWGPAGSTTNSLNCTGTIDIAQNPGGNTFDGVNFGGRMGFTYLLDKRSSTANLTGYPFVSTISYPASPTTISYSDINLTINILYAGPSSTTQSVVQTIQVTLPGKTLPMPTLPANYRSQFLKTGIGYTPRFSNLQDKTQPSPAWKSYNVIQPEDVMQTVQCASGDARLIAGLQNVPSGAYAPHPLYGTQALAHSLFMSYPQGFYGATGGKLVPGVTYNNVFGNNSTVPDVPAPAGVFIGAGGSPPGSVGTIPGDWDNAIANIPDGPYINKADEGSNTNPAYFANPEQGQANDSTFFSANRQMPSPGMFGSLPTGVIAGKPWQTLLFRPGPAGHPGQGLPAPTTTGVPVGALPYTTLPDFLLMDLFQMPVAEPYAISEPFSTAGKVNMNYQIVPFTYITRETAIRAAMKSEMIMAIPNSDGQTYKTNAGTANYRFPINMTETLKGFTARFNNNDIFRSASEICSLDLVPTTGGASSGNMWAGSNFWSTHGLTGDNTLERPNTNIYQRLTTKSNTFMVHFRVQKLVKPVARLSLDPTTFDESKGDTIGAEYRGYSIVERYIDPNDTNLPDFADPANASAVVDSYYHYHVLTTKQFSP